MNKPIGADTTFVYDADGARIKRAHGDTATYYIGAIEIETDSGDVVETHSIYDLGGGVTAVRVVASAGDDGEVTFTFGDHLGSSSTVWQAGELGDTDPGARSFQRYYPYGEPRNDYNPALPTDHTFTGQISDGLLDDGGTGLMYYGARYYDPQVGRFAAADTIVPDPGNPQGLNWYTYVSNNPVNGADPSGHDPCRDAKGNPTNCPTRPPESGGDREESLPDLPDPVTVTGSLDTRSAWHPFSWFSHVVDWATGRDAGDYSDHIMAVAAEAGIDPLLLHAVVEHESRHQSITGFLWLDEGYDLGAAWLSTSRFDVDPSIGMAQMKISVFLRTVRNHPEAFPEDVEVPDLYTNDLLSITAAAYHLSDLQAALDDVSVNSPLDERYLVALGYNVGQTEMLRVAQGGALGPRGATYLGYIAEHYGLAYDFYCGGGHGFSCS